MVMEQRWFSFLSLCLFSKRTPRFLFKWEFEEASKAVTPVVAALSLVPGSCARISAGDEEAGSHRTPANTFRKPGSTSAPAWGLHSHTTRRCWDILPLVFRAQPPSFHFNWSGWCWHLPSVFKSLQSFAVEGQRPPVAARCGCTFPPRIKGHQGFEI